MPASFGHHLGPSGDHLARMLLSFTLLPTPSPFALNNIPGTPRRYRRPDGRSREPLGSHDPAPWRCIQPAPDSDFSGFTTAKPDRPTATRKRRRQTITRDACTWGSAEPFTLLLYLYHDSPCLGVIVHPCWCSLIAGHSPPSSQPVCSCGSNCHGLLPG